jgi:hypothetical protein
LLFASTGPATSKPANRNANNAEDCLCMPTSLFRPDSTPAGNRKTVDRPAKFQNSRGLSNVGDK